ncbi:MAG: hypothetical protein JW912_08520 [Sedimentisphaerales bacterium]|nr:hypothetical protein [Sedimentisphaerales bacterium]
MITEQNHNTKKKTDKLTVISSICLVIILCSILVVSVIVHYTTLIPNAFVRQETLGGIWGCLLVYEHDNNDELPPLDKWCDELIKKANAHPRMFAMDDQVYKTCGYALNKNLQNLKFPQIPDDMVVVFEARGEWNLVGGPELLGTRKPVLKRYGVIFGNGDQKFIKKEEFGTLRWEP